MILASAVKAGAYYRIAGGSTLFVASTREVADIVGVDTWSDCGGAWTQLTVRMYHVADVLDWLPVEAPVLRCPADTGAGTEPTMRLVWRRVGRTRTLVSTAAPEPGDEAFVFAGLTEAT